MSMTFATFFGVTTHSALRIAVFLLLCSVASIKEVNGNERTQENNFVRSDCDAMWGRSHYEATQMESVVRERIFEAVNLAQQK